MTSRRIVSNEQTLLEKDDGPSVQDSSVAPAVPSSVIIKLLGFTLAMVTLPIGTYFLTVNSVFKGNSTFAGGLAAVVANVVLIAYVIVAMKEDQSERLEVEKNAKKSR
ncbi:uncharacterized protein K452DRAFT_242161 [Aplosporella prunicola CBS 121167]|uniref:Uncharacterized protein n=1 Tax=Aplosporella prunicola CBS 121167 TaxID=1176127 RepID=A0A6A6BUI3_9PEZI|nr:uncharacterized protein K452DRAFT_242161 [Aplosporella prunicola CBS 121167]KAF2146935.1 hypothetical protein K452DRAFT_242161 [Aplosporella prunicola CBS 121167]